MPLVATAIDVARAMAHLHKHNIVHSDLKARNVLLRSDMQDPRGFTAKVAGELDALCNGCCAQSQKNNHVLTEGFPACPVALKHILIACIS